MKTKISLLTVFMFFSLVSLTAKEKQVEEFKVYGNCGMCEKRVETAAKAVDGVFKAEWDSETKLMKVTFDAAKTDVKKIQKAVADVGHDTDLYTAKNEVYDKLHGCCKYERPEPKAADKE